MNRSATEYSRLFCALLGAAAIGTLAGCRSNRVAAAVPDEFEGAPVTDAAMEVEEVTDAAAVAAAEAMEERVGSEPAMAAAPDGTMMPVLQTFSRPDGLMIEDLRLGEGKEATSDSSVVIFYRGTLEDGKVFDASRGQTPAKFPLARLIQGWQEGIPGMKVGGIRRLTVPPEMAYAEEGVPAAGIPANATLTFSIELLDVQERAQANVER